MAGRGREGGREGGEEAKEGGREGGKNTGRKGREGGGVGVQQKNRREVKGSWEIERVGELKKGN